MSTITNDNNFIQGLGILLHFYYKIRGISNHLFRSKTNVTKLKSFSFGYCKSKITVKISNRTISCSFHNNIYTNKRLLF